MALIPLVNTNRRLGFLDIFEDEDSRNYPVGFLDDLRRSLEDILSTIVLHNSCIHLVGP